VIEEEQERFETELQRATPASLPTDLMDRLRAAKTGSQPIGRPEPGRISGWIGWFVWVRWVIAATPMAVAAILLVRSELRPNAGPGKISSAASATIKANAIQVDHALVSSFDAVAQLPGGEPVRFRCRKWMDDVVMRDDAHGVVISQSSPRVEVIPVRFETY
jgi:hypothetical protein